VNTIGAVIGVPAIRPEIAANASSVRHAARSSGAAGSAGAN